MLAAIGKCGGGAPRAAFLGDAPLPRRVRDKDESSPDPPLLSFARGIAKLLQNSSFTVKIRFIINMVFFAGVHERLRPIGETHTRSDAKGVKVSLARSLLCFPFLLTPEPSSPNSLPWAATPSAR